MDRKDRLVAVATLISAAVSLLELNRCLAIFVACSRFAASAGLKSESIASFSKTEFQIWDNLLAFNNPTLFEASSAVCSREEKFFVKLLGNLELFVAVAKALSFSQAAQSLGLPASTLSRRIAEFERGLGLPLFVRTTRRVELTEAARRLLARCESIVEAAREARDEALGVAAHPSGILRISLEADVGTALISPSVAELCQKYPDIKVDLDLSPRRVDLIGESFDLAVRLGALPDSSLVARQITSLSVGLYAAPGYLKRNGLPRSPEELKSHGRLHLLHAQDTGDWQLTAGRRKVTIERRGAVVSANNMTMLRSLLRFGLGIGVMDQVMAAEDLRGNSLVRVLPAWSLPPVAVSILTPGRLIPAKTRVFIELLLKRLASMSAKGK